MAESPSFRLTTETGTAGARGGGRGESLIDAASHFTGSFRTPHDLRVEGRYDGEIECQGTVFIGETAQVNARILAGSIAVAGQCEGEIVCAARFEILPSGRVSGSVTTGSTVVHEGAFYQGELRMTRSDAADGNSAAAVRTPTPALPPRAATTPALATAGRDRPVPAVEPAVPAPEPLRRPAAAPVADDEEVEIPLSLVATAAGPRQNGAGNGRAAAQRPDRSRGPAGAGKDADGGRPAEG